MAKSIATRPTRVPTIPKAGENTPIVLNTLASASSLEVSLGEVGKNNTQVAIAVGVAIAERAKKAGVKEAYFDRGGYLFHGKVKALAEAAREGGLKI